MCPACRQPTAQCTCKAAAPAPGKVWEPGETEICTVKKGMPQEAIDRFIQEHKLLERLRPALRFRQNAAPRRARSGRRSARRVRSRRSPAATFAFLGASGALLAWLAARLGWRQAALASWLHAPLALLLALLLAAALAASGDERVKLYTELGQEMMGDLIHFPMVNPQLVIASQKDITGNHYSGCCNLDLSFLGITG